MLPFARLVWILPAVAWAAAACRQPSPPPPTPSPPPVPSPPPGPGGTYALRPLSVEGEGCRLVSQTSTLDVAVSGGRIEVRADGLGGSGALGPDGSFTIEVADPQGRRGELSGRLEAGRLASGRLAAFGCVVRFEGTRVP